MACRRTLRAGGSVRWVGSAMGLAILLAGCAASSEVYETVGRYDVPEQTIDVPRTYPNVFTTVTREDTPMAPTDRESVIADMVQVRDTHAEQAAAEIEAQ